jgi:hypothetical protein
MEQTRILALCDGDKLKCIKLLYWEYSHVCWLVFLFSVRSHRTELTQLGAKRVDPLQAYAGLADLHVSIISTAVSGEESSIDVGPPSSSLAGEMAHEYLGR